MELYKFFNSTAEDPRTYQATDFANYFGSVLSTGFLHTDNVPGLRARVIPGTLRTSVTSGKAIMEGHLYENTSTLELTHDLPETTADRIDRVILRLNLENAERNIKLHVIKGTPSGNPVAPTLRRDNFVYEISLARVRVRANTVQLLPEDLYDERLNSDAGGLVSSLISIPVDQFQQQWDDLMESVQSEGFTPTASFTAHKDDLSAHGIGNREGLLTANKTTLVAAINEAFQSASNGKIAIKNAVTGVDPKIVIPANPTFPQLATAISQINTGKKWAQGSVALSPNPSTYYDGMWDEYRSMYTTEVIGLTFTPSIIYIRMQESADFAYIYDKNRNDPLYKIISVEGMRIGSKYRLENGAYVNAQGFKLPISRYGGTYTWMAIE